MPLHEHSKETVNISILVSNFARQLFPKNICKKNEISAAFFFDCLCGSISQPSNAVRPQGGGLVRIERCVQEQRKEYTLNKFPIKTPKK